MASTNDTGSEAMKRHNYHRGTGGNCMPFTFLYIEPSHLMIICLFHCLDSYSYVPAIDSTSPANEKQTHSHHLNTLSRSGHLSDPPWLDLLKNIILPCSNKLLLIWTSSCGTAIDLDPNQIHTHSTVKISNGKEAKLLYRCTLILHVEQTDWYVGTNS